MASNNVDKKMRDIQNLVARSAPAKEVLKWLAARTKNSVETSIDRMYSKMDLEREEITAVMQEFEKIGLGKYVTGRRGFKTRFVWEFGLVSVGQVAFGKMHTLEPLAPTEIDDDGAEEQPRQTTAPGTMVSQPPQTPTPAAKPDINVQVSREASTVMITIIMPSVSADTADKLAAALKLAASAA